MRRRGSREGGEQPDRLVDLGAVPSSPVLVGQQHQLPVAAHACVTARVLQQHQRQQGVELAVRRGDLADDPGQPDRLTRQLGAVHVIAGCRGVRGGERQVGDVGREPDALRQLDPGRDLEPLTGQSLAGTGQPRRHGRRTDQEEPRDVGRADAEHQPQGQRRGRLGCQDRVGTEQDQAQSLVVHLLPGVGHDSLRLLLQARLDGEHRPLAGRGGLGAEPVDDPPTGGSQQPSGRVGGVTVARPGAGGGFECVREAVLGQVEALVLRD